jgi:hypothetical protein
MADVKISQLPAAGSASDDMQIEVNNAGTSQSVTVANIRTQVKYNGSAVGTRKSINFIPGSNVTLTVTDDSGSDEVDVTIASSGGGGASGGTEYTVTTTNASGTVIATISLASSTATGFEAIIVGRRTDVGGEGGMWKVEGVCDNIAGTSALIGDFVKTVFAKDDTDWYVDATVDDAADSLKIWVYGEASKTINWKALVRTVVV